MRRPAGVRYTRRCQSGCDAENASTNASARASAPPLRSKSAWRRRSARRLAIHAAAIAGTGCRTRCLAFGAIDYTLDIGTSLSEDGSELFYARAQLVAASRASNCEAPVDTVYPNFRDAEGLRRECRLARKLGFQGKMLIHPDQIAIAHEVFSPSAEEIAHARRVVEVFEKAEREGIASVSLDGKMIDYPVFNRARNLLETLE